MTDKIDIQHSYKFHEEINISEIRKEENYWSYVVLEIPYKMIYHRTFYYSTNLLALNRHRDAMIAKYEARKKENSSSSFSQGIEVIPTITERIIATKEQKIRK